VVEQDVKETKRPPLGLRIIGYILAAIIAIWALPYLFVKEWRRERRESRLQQHRQRRAGDS
jgi:hypothetical protein